MMTILLYGFLGKKFGKVHRFAVRTPAEAVRALMANFPTFKKEMNDGGYYKVSRGGKETLGVDNLRDPQSTRETIRFIPVATGASGLFNLIAGTVLTIIGFISENPYIIGMGVSMIMGGASQLLFTPRGTAGESVEAADNKPSYAFDGAVNTVAQGNPVPVCYGRLLVGSQIISAGLSAEQL